ncbi:MAG: hypothetical protein JST22_04325 [Bacteroidetes bacterium]|nr:hypothetical protein [Bacteroidota bacterium]
MDVLLKIHSGTRWVVAGVIVLALIKLLSTWLRRSEFGGGDRGLLSAAVGLIDLQVLIGIVLAIGLGGFPRPRMEHVVTMILAAVAAHSTARFKRADSTTRARNSFLLLLVAAVLIAVGVIRLRGGWMF